MKNTIKNLIKIAEATENIDTQIAILEEVKNIINKFAITYNCPSNWRNIGEELEKEYNTENYNYIYESLELWNHAE